MLTTQRLCKSFASGEGKVYAVRDVDLTIGRGEFVSIAGPSGSGKPPLLHVLSTLLSPDSGLLSYNGMDLTSLSPQELNRLRREEFAVIFQQPHMLHYMTVLENVLLPFAQGIKPVPARAVDKARECLARVGLAGKEKRLPSKLSGGEQQRVAIARALAAEAKVLFADEPTGSLDSRTGEGVIQLLEELNTHGLTVVLVTHNPEFACRAGREYWMEDGRLREGADQKA